MGAQITGIEQVGALRKVIGADAAELIGTAMALGWKAQHRAAGGVTIIAPGAVKTLHFSTRHKGHGNLEAMMRTVARYGDQETYKRLRNLAADPEVSPRGFEQAILASAMTKNLMDQYPITPKGAFGQNTYQEAGEQPVDAVAVAPAPTPVPTTPKPYVVTQRPAMMHRSLTPTGGKSYPSKTAIERKWSDGHIDYICAIPNCDAEPSELKRAFAGSHWGKHVRAGEATPVTQEEINSTLVDDPNYTKRGFAKGPNERRQDKVQAVLDFLNALDLELTKEQVAVLFVQRFMPESDGINVGINEPMTDSQVIDRIRRLVDHGTYAEQERVIEQTSRELAELQAKIGTVKAEADETLALERVKRERAEGSLRTLHELLEGEISNGQSA